MKNSQNLCYKHVIFFKVLSRKFSNKNKSPKRQSKMNNSNLQASCLYLSINNQLKYTIFLTEKAFYDSISNLLRNNQIQDIQCNAPYQSRSIDLTFLCCKWLLKHLKHKCMVKS
jgi:hypothetical protein